MSVAEPPTAPPPHTSTSLASPPSRRTGSIAMIVGGACVLVLLIAGIAGWLVFQSYQSRKEMQAQLARQAEAAAKNEKLAQSERKFDRLLQEVRDAQLRADGFQRDYESAAKAFSERPSRQTFDLMQGASDKLTTERKKGLSAADELQRFADSADLSAETRSDFNAKLRQPAANLKSSFNEWDRFEAWQKSVQTRTLKVNSNQGWQSSGISAKRGDRIAVNSTGQWRWGTFTAKWVGAQGENAGTEWRTDKSFANGALLARVGGGGNHLGVGAFTAEQLGEVQFRINDEQVGDNQGQLDVDFWVFPVFAPAK